MPHAVGSESGVQPGEGDRRSSNRAVPLRRLPRRAVRSGPQPRPLEVLPRMRLRLADVGHRPEALRGNRAGGPAPDGLSPMIPVDRERAKIDQRGASDEEGRFEQ
jgi:hypothetical protein